MSRLRILLVDDEPDIRDVVELSLGLDPVFSVRSCDSGANALAAAADWSPDMILCDVMMPDMDGPATLARLRDCPQTADTPVVFMTARAQTRELEHFASLGVTGVIAKPFDPMNLANLVRCHLRSAGLARMRGGFVKRLRADGAALARHRACLGNEGCPQAKLEQIKACAHALVGSAGIFGFEDVSCAASAVEKSAIDRLTGEGAPGMIETALDTLIDRIAQV